MKALKIIIGSFLLLGCVKTIIDGFGKENDSAGLTGFLIGAGLFGIIGILLINSGFKKTN